MNKDLSDLLELQVRILRLSCLTIFQVLWVNDVSETINNFRKNDTSWVWALSVRWWEALERTLAFCSVGDLQKITITSKYKRAKCQFKANYMKPIDSWKVLGSLRSLGGARKINDRQYCHVKAVSHDLGRLFQLFISHYFRLGLRSPLILLWRRCIFQYGEWDKTLISLSKWAFGNRCKERNYIFLGVSEFGAAQSVWAD